MRSKLYGLVSLAIILLVFVATEAVIAGTVELPKTGQTASYYSRDDGDLEKGVVWPEPRFSVNGNTTITDKLTGLIWGPNGNIMQSRDPGFDTDGTSGDGAVFWNHALDYVAKLNTENYLGHSDWRLANVNELESLINVAEPNSVTWLNSQGFANVQLAGYWSSTRVDSY